MTREFLKTLGIEDKAVIDSIMDENGKDINAEKTKFADYETLKTQLSDANKKIEEFGKLDFDGVKAMADDYKAKFEQAQADSKKQLDELRFNHAIDGALSSAKAKNIKAVKALLETDKLKLNKDGSLTGLSEQLEKIKSENDYLFETENAPSPAPHFLGGSGGTPPTADDSAVRAIMGLPPASK
ncbi:MAG: phage scaffolding protein [Oscillospiraceae bacterium]